MLRREMIKALSEFEPTLVLGLWGPSFGKRLRVGGETLKFNNNVMLRLLVLHMVQNSW